jgi:hypothetical protein
MKPGAAIMKLTDLGYHFHFNGEKIVFKWQGAGEPDPSQVAPLFEAIKADREAAILFLRTYCPRCGSCFFWNDLWGKEKCMNCDPPDWQLLERLFPQTQRVRH